LGWAQLNPTPAILRGIARLIVQVKIEGEKLEKGQADGSSTTPI